MNKKIEVIVIEDDMEVVHRSVSTVDEYANTFNIVINAMIDQLTGYKAKPAIQDKFAAAVPNYVPMQVSQQTEVPSTHLEAKVAFHPDLINQGAAPKVTKVVENGIPVVKLKMSDILKGK